jgi:hypothetical protein
VTPLFKPGDVLFHRAPVFMVWLMLTLIMITVASGASPVFTALSLRIKKYFGLSGRQFGLSVLFAVLFLIIMGMFPMVLKGFLKPVTLAGLFNILLDNERIIPATVAAMLVLVLPIIVVKFLVVFAANKSTKRELDKEGFEIAAKQLNYLSEVLLSALQVLAVIVVLTVFASRALNDSIKSLISIEGAPTATEVSYVYGLYFSLFLGMLYIPVYFYLRQQSLYLRQQLDAYQQMTTEKDEKWNEKVAGLFLVKNSALENLKLALTVLAPLISGFLPDHLFS